jgi:hypothetical protein
MEGRSMKQQKKKDEQSRTKKSRAVRVPQEKSGSKEVTAEFKAGKDLEA